MASPISSIFKPSVYEIITNLHLTNALISLQTAEEYSLIINCTKGISFPKDSESKNCIRLSIKDLPPNSNKMLNLIYETNIIENIHNDISKNKKVLVYCFFGMQRSCTIIACYLIKYHDMTPTESIDYIKSIKKSAFFITIYFQSTIQRFYDNLQFRN
jgi:predicted protein tyrosine phosphatase